MMLEHPRPSFRRALAFLCGRSALGEEIGDIVLVLLTIYRDDEGRRVVADLADVLADGVDVELAFEGL